MYQDSGLLFAIACYTPYRNQATVKGEVADPRPCEPVETVDLVWVKNR